MCKVATSAFYHRLLLFAMPMVFFLRFFSLFATLTHGRKVRAESTFHYLHRDFAHRAREAGRTLEEVAYYLGHVTTRGTPAIQTTVRYTKVSRAKVKEQLKLLKG